MLRKKYSGIISVEDEELKLKNKVHHLQEEIEKTRSTYSEKREILNELEKQVAVYDETLSFAELGLYEPHFDFGDSEIYKEQIKNIRQHQKEMIASKTATICPVNWYVENSRAKGRTMINRQTRLTMRAFNNECEAAISNTRWNNVVAMEKRILNAAKQINKTNASMNLSIDDSYVSAKLRELYLTHEYREQVKIEKDKRAELARAKRDERRLLAEAAAAEREERRYQTLLDKARREIRQHEGSAEMEARIKELESALAESHSKCERARAMAEMTKCGFVYVVSNVGSFGEDIVKIGLTRRINPEDRIRELGDASVPFKFDTHALIYSEEAPSLESALHKEFSDRRVNLSNMRKEFFRVSMQEVQDAVNKLVPEASFFKDREAQEWHETLARRKKVLMQEENKVERFPASI